MSRDELEETLDVIENELRTAKVSDEVVRRMLKLAGRVVCDAIIQRNRADHLGRLLYKSREEICSPGAN